MNQDDASLYSDFKLHGDWYLTPTLFKGQLQGKRMKRQPTEREMTFAIHTSNKGQVSRVYKELLQINKKDSPT